MTISFWRPRDEYGAFSNFSPHGFILDGYVWKTSEHWYQANKFVPGGDAYMHIFKAKTPKEAKEIAYASEGFRLDWESRKVDVMMRGLRAKFTQNPDLKDLLLSTGSKVIVENSPKDWEWGCGADGKGKNLLGMCLMNLRKELAEEQSCVG